jgi:hypothetical protein
MCSKFGGTSECDALASPAKLKFCTPFPLNFEKIRSFLVLIIVKASTSIPAALTAMAITPIGDIDFVFRAGVVYQHEIRNTKKANNAVLSNL